MTRGREIPGQEIEQHRRKARFDQRVHVASEDRKIPAAAKEDGEHAGGEEFVGDEGRERRERGARRQTVAIDRPDEAGSERHRQEDQDENESQERGQNEHAPPLADENLAVQQMLKGRAGRVSGIVHLDPFGARAAHDALDLGLLDPEVEHAHSTQPGTTPGV